MPKIMLLIVVIALYLLLDYYAFQLVRHATLAYPAKLALVLRWGFWVGSFLLILGLILFSTGVLMASPRWVRAFFQGLTIVVILPKIFLAVFALVDDVVRLVRWVASLVVGEPETEQVPVKKGIGRAEFIAQAGMVAASIPLVASSYGILSGAHDYRVRRRTVVIKNLPSAFHGLRIAQLSDIHAGSFWNKRAVQGGVDMLLAEKPDLVVFTGDLVNDRASEMQDYGDVFGRVSAPLGVYSILGNHDYGDYVQWKDAHAKQQNLLDLIEIEKQMGWRPLIDEHITLGQGADRLALVGIQNWSAKLRFPRHGNLEKALRGTEDVPVRILLSHDPSHWRAEVLPLYADKIDLTLSGHTHGAQFGIELGNYRWSPVSMVYQEWADLYQEGDNYLYVNRGYGYIGYPGRLGILPEITIIELAKG